MHTEAAGDFPQGLSFVEPFALVFEPAAATHYGAMTQT
jgi:hypothetical protein